MDLKNNKILAIIPARGGSKGLNNKNIVNICGKPLIYYTAKPTRRLEKEGLIDKVILSTDSKEISDVVKSIGVEVPFLRPKKISGDKSKSIELVIHAINFFE